MPALPLLLACAASAVQNDTGRPPRLDCRRPTARPPALPSAMQTSHGPEYGTLVLAGGALKQNSTVFQRILELAGGPEEARLVYIPTNGGGSYSTPAQRQRELDEFLSTSGWGNLKHPVVLVHTYSREEANTPEFTAPIEAATGVYFRGGRPYHSHDAYKNTRTHEALEDMLRRGGVLAGSSAGALMQTNLMLRGDRTRGNQIVLGDPHDGFGFAGMKNLVCDVHNLFRNRANDMVELFQRYPEMLGLNVDEDTAAVLRGDSVECVGTGWVVVYDPTLWQPFDEEPWCADFRLQMGAGRPLVPNHGRFFFLATPTFRPPNGDRYDVRVREITASSFDLAAAAVDE